MNNKKRSDKTDLDEKIRDFVDFLLSFQPKAPPVMYSSEYLIYRYPKLKELHTNIKKLNKIRNSKIRIIF